MTFRQRWANKYGAKRCEYNGYIYMSKAEAAQAAELDLLLKAGEIKAWERQVKVPPMVNGRRVANYFVDFLIHHNDGTREFLEVKGMELPMWRMKWKHFEAQCEGDPTIKLTVVKVRSRFQPWRKS